MENASFGNLQVYLKDETDATYYNIGNNQKLPQHMNFIHQIIRGVKAVQQLEVCK